MTAKENSIPTPLIDQQQPPPDYLSSTMDDPLTNNPDENRKTNRSID